MKEIGKYILTSAGNIMFRLPMLLFSLGLNTSKAQCTAFFTPVYGLNGMVTFSTIAIQPQYGQFTFHYGDGSPADVFFMNSYNPTHTYQNGTYTVMLSVMDYSVNPTCNVTYSQVVTVTSYTCNLKASFTSSAVTTSTVPNLVTFDASPTIGANGNTRYYWDFGDGTSSGPGSSNFAWHAYPTNGSYTVLLVVSDITAPTCINSFSAKVSAAGCLTAAFTHTVIGSVTGFNSISVNTNTGTIYYYWDFDDGTTSSLQNPTHIYLNSGAYLVKLKTKGPGLNCTDSIIQPVNIPGGPCPVTAAFLYTITGSSVAFHDVSIGTNISTIYYWDFGDGTISTLQNPTHAYLNSGSYTVKLKIKNSGPPCPDSLTQSINIPVMPCYVAAAFVHTITGGSATFHNISTGTNTGTIYYWDFGDGITSTLQDPAHTYLSAGAYLVKLKIEGPGFNCRDSIIQSVNISGVPCSANSNFSMVPTSTAQVWNAVPAFPWNATAASWNWGDGSVSNTLYTSHQYSAAGLYSICLSVTVSCGASSSYCYQYYLSKLSEGSAQIVYINVINPSLIASDLDEAQADQFSFNVYPNPSIGVFTIHFAGQNSDACNIRVYDLLGKEVFSGQNGDMLNEPVKTVELDGISNGIYFIYLVSGKRVYTNKIIVSR